MQYELFRTRAIQLSSMTHTAACDSGMQQPFILQTGVEQLLAEHLWEQDNSYWNTGFNWDNHE
jgi:hypothetical protein